MTQSRMEHLFRLYREGREIRRTKGVLLGGRQECHAVIWAVAGGTEGRTFKPGADSQEIMDFRGSPGYGSWSMPQTHDLKGLSFR